MEKIEFRRNLIFDQSEGYDAVDLLTIVVNVPVHFIIRLSQYNTSCVLMLVEFTIIIHIIMKFGGVKLNSKSQKRLKII